MIAVQAKQRGVDAWGSGGWHASRKRADGTRYKHEGVDYAVEPGQLVLSDVVGQVSKVGFPYSPDDAVRGHLRYIEIRLYESVRVNGVDCRYVRYFYVSPRHAVGSYVSVGMPLGTAADLTVIYFDKEAQKHITNHYHMEVLDGDRKRRVNPDDFLKVYNS